MRKYGSIRPIVTIFVAVAIGLFLTGISIAGSLEPSDPPGPTMKTLDEVYSAKSWSTKFSCETTTNCPRFEVLADFNNEAVLDKETGLVWYQSPSTDRFNWQAAQGRCNQWCRYSSAGRCGWRLPTVQELGSLIDPSRFSLQGVSTLPSGNPFSNVQATSCFVDAYWSATTVLISGTASAMSVTFTPGCAPNLNGALTNENYVWCVRGGQGVDAQ